LFSNQFVQLITFLKNIFSEKQREIFRYWLKSIPAFFYQSNLSKLAQLYGTDKYEHGYTEIYKTYFRELKTKRLRILEIGIGGGNNIKFGGNSIKMWAKYFPFSQILGIDIYDKSLVDYRRIKTYKGNQTDAEFMSQFTNLDIIIDDGGHINSEVICSFELLFTQLNSGGFYCVEDIENSYWEESGGSETSLDKKGTMINYFKEMTDALNRDIMRNELIIVQLRSDIQFIHFYKNLIVIKKR
jgi:hypothetical protein